MSLLKRTQFDTYDSLTKISLHDILNFFVADNWKKKTYIKKKTLALKTLVSSSKIKYIMKVQGTIFQKLLI